MPVPRQHAPAPTRTWLKRARVQNAFNPVFLPILAAIGILTAMALTWYITAEPLTTGAITAIAVLVSALACSATISRLRIAAANAGREQAELRHALHRAQPIEAVGRLTLGIAHDFNNHLTAISSNTELAARFLEPSQDRVAHHLNAALQGVRRAAMLSSRLLSASRRQPAEPEMVDINCRITNLAALLGRVLGGRIGLDVQVPPEPWFIWADANHLDTALLSLLGAVRDWVAEGDTLIVAVSNEPRHPAMLQRDACVQITVRARMSPAPALTSNDLCLARDFAQAAGGFLRCSADAIRVVLPRYVPPSLANRVMPNDGMADGVMTNPGGGRGTEGPTILLVEDDAPVRIATAAILRGHGFTVLEAPDALEAFRVIAEREGVDLLLTDLGLPNGVDGKKLADAAHHADPTIAVVYTTGQDIGWKTADLLRKPFSAAELLTAVRAALGNAAATGEAEPASRVSPASATDARQPQPALDMNPDIQPINIL